MSVFSNFLVFLLFGCGMVAVADKSDQGMISAVVKKDDLIGIDADILRDLIHSINANVASAMDNAQCNDSHELYTLKLLELDTTYVDKLVAISLPIGGSGIVSTPRKRAMALMTKAALTLPEGDIVETGCFIGTSAAIIMNILLNFDACGKKLWVFDSFQGLPTLGKEDANTVQTDPYIASYETFTTNLQSIGLLDEHRLVVTKGWFNETLHTAPISRISLLHLDGDLYESTWEALVALYDKVVPGGYVLVDDYGSYPGCRHAIDRFRHHKRIYEPLHFVQETVENPGIFPMIRFEAVYWIKRRHA